ncbi:MAG: phenylalanyl-tRNA synthetase alpha chain [Actinomycetota bacterium]|nr:phenylalanyl-tRNA synthetase alpha chain [Actinomycetota bacterium]
MTGAADLRERFEKERTDALKRVSEATDLASLEEARVRVLGRRSSLAEARSGLRDLSDSERRELGQIANGVQAEIEAALEAKRAEFESKEKAKRWEAERVDVTLPGRASPVGSLHPLTRTLWSLVDIFVGMGYTVAEGPEAELTTLNFDALNTPFEHPSRSPSDTFYVKGSDEEVCLRTQTSPVQIRVMQSTPPPIYIVAPGRTYRRDAQDATHTSQFFQMEGLVVDKGITMGDLKGTLQVFARATFGEDLEVRLRPHFFPFTEPSAEMDVECFTCRGQGCRVCKGEGWIEVLGCGMVHPNVLEWCGIDPETYSGFAFGMGVERIAALSHGISDIRAFYENDLRFLDQFAGMA